jgi:hypothetical protein
LILALRTKSGGVLHEGHICAEDQWNGGGGVLGWLARFLFLPPHRLPKSQQKYIGGTSLVIGQQMRVTNQGKKMAQKAGMADLSNRINSFSIPFRCPNVYVYVGYFLTISANSQEAIILSHPILRQENITSLRSSCREVGPLKWFLAT